MNRKQIVQLVLGLSILVTFLLISYKVFFKTELTKEEIDRTDMNIVKLDTITTNVQGGVYHYLKMDVRLHVPNEQNRLSLESYMPQVRRAILNISMMQDGKSLITPEGKAEFKNLIRYQIRKQFGIVVKDVYFSNFVLAD